MEGVEVEEEEKADRKEGVDKEVVEEKDDEEVEVVEGRR